MTKADEAEYYMNRERIDVYMAAIIAADIASNGDANRLPRCMDDPKFWLKEFVQLAIEGARAVDVEVGIEQEVVTEDRIEAMRNKRGINSIWIK